MWRAGLLAGWLAVVACGDAGPTEPQDHRIPMGLYQYEFRYTPRPLVDFPSTERVHEGTMEVQECTEMEMMVAWDVEGFDPEPEYVVWKERTYYIFGPKLESWSVTHESVHHRLTRKAKTKIQCEAEVVWIEGGELHKIPGTCSVTF